jgi:mutator protein MutT
MRACVFMRGSSTKPLDVVAALIWRDDRVLVCQRQANGAFPLKWEFPGGKVEAGESELEALRRELREELGIVVRQCRKIFAHCHVYPSGMKVRLKFFYVKSYEGEVRNLAFEEISWVEVSNLPRLDFLTGDLPLIKKLLSDDGLRRLSRSS